MSEIKNPVDLIAKKARGKYLGVRELSAFFQGRQCETTNVNHVAAFLMASCIKGLSAEESCDLANVLASSRGANKEDLVAVLSLGPHDASCGAKVALLSGILLASVGFRVEMVSVKDSTLTCRPVEYFEQIREFQGRFSGPEILQRIASSDVVVAHLPDELAPACHELDRLLTETATYSSPSLLASVILAPHIALGASHYALHLWYGAGELLPTQADAMEFGRTAAELVRSLGAMASVVVTDGTQPLGRALGVPLEIEEIVDILAGNGPSDIREHSLNVAARVMMALDGSENFNGAKERLAKQIASGRSVRTLLGLVKRQGGRATDVSGSNADKSPAHVREVVAPSSGYVHSIDLACLYLIVAQLRKLWPNARTGILLHKTIGDRTQTSEPLASIVGQDTAVLSSFEFRVAKAYSIKRQPSSAPSGHSSFMV